MLSPGRSCGNLIIHWRVQPSIVWKGALAPEYVRIAYTTSRHTSIPTEECLAFGCNQPIPPFSLRVTNLFNGSTTTVWESYSHKFMTPVWSPDGTKIAFSRVLNNPYDVNPYRQVPFPLGSTEEEGSTSSIWFHVM